MSSSSQPPAPARRFRICTSFAIVPRDLRRCDGDVIVREAVSREPKRCNRALLHILANPPPNQRIIAFPVRESPAGQRILPWPEHCACGRFEVCLAFLSTGASRAGPVLECVASVGESHMGCIDPP